MNFLLRCSYGYCVFTHFDVKHLPVYLHRKLLEKYALNYEFTDRITTTSRWSNPTTRILLIQIWLCVMNDESSFFVSAKGNKNRTYKKRTPLCYPSNDNYYKTLGNYLRNKRLLSFLVNLLGIFLLGLWSNELFKTCYLKIQTVDTPLVIPPWKGLPLAMDVAM